MFDLILIGIHTADISCVIFTIFRFVEHKLSDHACHSQNWYAIALNEFKWSSCRDMLFEGSLWFTGRSLFHCCLGFATILNSKRLKLHGLQMIESFVEHKLSDHDLILIGIHIANISHQSTNRMLNFSLTS